MDRTLEAASVLFGAPPGTGHGCSETVAFAGYRLQADGTLWRGAALIHLPPKELAALRLLLANPGQIVTSAQIKKALWGDVHVTADSVPRCLSSLRARLQAEDCIQTVYKRGYRLLAEVRRQGDAEPVALPRLGIVPFLTGVAVPEHLGFAIAEETIVRLSNAEQPLAAILARDSVFTLASRGLTAQQIGETLQATLVLSGSLQAFPAHFRLRVEMIRVADGVQIWVEDLLVEKSRIAGIELELAARLNFRLRPQPFPAGPSSGISVAAVSPSGARLQRPAGAPAEASLGISLAASADAYFAAPYSAAPEAAGHDDRGPSVLKQDSARREAYEMYLRGRHECQTMERHRMQDGLQHLTRAIDLDPSLVAAKIDLVRLCAAQAGFGYMPPAAARELAWRTAETIPDSEADPALPSLGIFSLHVDHDLPGALWAFSTSAHLPHDASVSRSRVMFALSRQRYDEALALLEAALEQDPFAPWLHGCRAWTLHLAGRHSESLAQMRRCLELFPNNDGAALYGAIILTFNGDVAGGLRLAKALAERMPYLDRVSAIHAYTLACANHKSEARAILGRLRWLSRERFVSSSFSAGAYVALGEMENALAELQTAMDTRCPWFFQLLADPRLEPLHDSVQFQHMRSVLTRMEQNVLPGSGIASAAAGELPRMSH